MTHDITNDKDMTHDTTNDTSQIALKMKDALLNLHDREHLTG